MILLHEIVSVNSDISPSDIFFISFKESVNITFFVVIMMVIIDYVNVCFKGRFKNLMINNSRLSNLLSPVLGSSPGCLGAYMNVSMYAHGFMSFAGVTAGMIATFGDEFFRMVQIIPQETALITIILLVVAFLSIPIINFAAKRLGWDKCHYCKEMVVHEKSEQETICFNKKNIIKQLIEISKIRIYLILGAVGFATFYIFVGIEKHFNAMNVIFMIVTFVIVFIIFTTSEHFLKVHIVNHAVKKHLLRTFIWTFSVLVFFNLTFIFFDLKDFFEHHKTSSALIMLFIAAIVGIIPESGPHFIFISMYVAGFVPFSTLVVSSIVQDGHGMLPMLAYSRKDFFRIKLINIIIGLSVGLIFFCFGY